jgi:hypothetical protein
MSRTVRVYDPPMCCSTGVCGPSVDPNVLRAARDLAWLKAQGVAVERFNLAQQPQAFVDEPVVAAEMANPDALPLTLVDGVIVGRGEYLTRARLGEILGLAPPAEPTDLPMVRP